MVNRQADPYVPFTPQGYPVAVENSLRRGSSVTASIRFGRIAGIPVGASWSALLIAGLIAWSLAGSLLPAEVPGLAPADGLEQAFEW